MRQLTLAFIISFASFALSAAADGPSKETLLKARIVQLEAQLAQVAASEAVCRAQFASTQAQAAGPRFAAERAAIEKEAGCQLDWTTNPVVCKPTNPAK